MKPTEPASFQVELVRFKCGIARTAGETARIGGTGLGSRDPESENSTLFLLPCAVRGGLVLAGANPARSFCLFVCFLLGVNQ